MKKKINSKIKKGLFLIYYKNVMQLINKITKYYIIETNR